MKIIRLCRAPKSLNLCTVYSRVAAGHTASVVVVYLGEPQTDADVVRVWLKRLETHGERAERGREYLNPTHHSPSSRKEPHSHRNENGVGTMK